MNNKLFMKNNIESNTLDCKKPVFNPIFNELKAINQHKIKIENIEVYFPFIPYTNQITYMTSVIHSLNTRQYSALESPTGTGKSLCLLCACFAWGVHYQKNNKNRMPMIYYSTRTHSQIASLVEELKKTAYEPTMCILSSKDFSCVNSNVNNAKGGQLNMKCALLRGASKVNNREKKKCEYYKNVDMVKCKDFGIVDIEELCSIGNSHKFCPYYYETSIIQRANIVFLPYNYLICQDIRKAMGIDLQNAIVIFDEGHNIQKVCEDEESCYIDENIINSITNELFKNVSHHYTKNYITNEFDDVDLQMLIIELKDYIQRMKEIKVLKGKEYPDKGKILTFQEFFNIFIEQNKKVQSYENLTKYLKIIRNLKDNSELSGSNQGYMESLIKILSFIKHSYKVFLNNNDTVLLYNTSFTIYLCDIQDEKNKSKNKKLIRTLKILCFNPGFCFKKLTNLQPYTILLTSGTLTPISGIEQELNIRFPIQLENKHIISKEQILFSIISSSNLNNQSITYNFDYNHRFDDNIINQLGKSLLALSKIIPGGILIFFSSYSYMMNCYQLWLSIGIIKDISLYKNVIIEKKGNQLSYLNSIKGSIRFTVFRGSSSEGINFSDDAARLVLLIGIPFANSKDDKIALKKSFLDKNNIGLSGSDWYLQDCMRAVNQSLGRVIRHSKDYGVLIVIDERYTQEKIKQMFSGWLRDSIREDILNLNFLKRLINFFTLMKEGKNCFVISQKKEEDKKLELFKELCSVFGCSENKQEVSTINNNSSPDKDELSSIQMAKDPHPFIESSDKEKNSSITIEKIINFMNSK